MYVRKDAKVMTGLNRLSMSDDLAIAAYSNVYYSIRGLLLFMFFTSAVVKYCLR